ncbi:MAG: hypothetical protein QOF51_3215, partial [Chloroflexota bacterium]|nr:hypothetical protein [Chloroflexota bacterium]
MTASFFFIVNPAAGAGRGAAEGERLLAAARARGLSFECEWSRGAETATSFARQALRAGAETIVAVGGDGTVNEVLNGFFLNGE